MVEDYSKELVARLYHSMLLIRRVEEKVAEIYHTDVIKSPVHLSIGQEAVASGVCDALGRDDFVSNTYRCHATYIAKGGDLNAMMAELYGKSGGCAGGKAGSMHLIDMTHGVMGASAVVGTTIPVATGYALALRRKAQKNKRSLGHQPVVTTIFGDGATEEGCFSESINFAALHKLPQIFICENNKLAIHEPIEKRWATDRICERMETYGLKTYRITDGDVFKIREITAEAAEFARNPDNPPVFIECFTYRYMEHVGPTEDLNEAYRDMDEYKKWRENDQIDRLAAMLPAADKEKIDKQVEEEIAAAQDFAESSPFPSDEELKTYVYA